MNITASIVVYNTDYTVLRKLVKCLENEETDILLYVIDNSPTEELGKQLPRDSIRYIFNGRNIGYGAAHNIALRESLQESKYHIILNPDIYFPEGTVQRLLMYLEENPTVGLVMPKILFPDGSNQFLCKLLPRPIDLVMRNFLPGSRITQKINYRYEMRFSDYDRSMNVPYLSGCFMFIRTDVLKYVGLFDERFFLYFEDTDLSRRIHNRYKTVCHPFEVAYHNYGRGSYSDRRLLQIHIRSAMRYFNKWGWFFDRERREINRRAIEFFAMRFSQSGERTDDRPRPHRIRMSRRKMQSS
jgi:GT2 family glycosyltransferase